MENHDGNILEEIINQIGIRKNALADKLSINRGTLNRWIMKEYIPNDTLIQVGKALRIDMSAYYERLRTDPNVQQVSVFNEDPAEYVSRLAKIEQQFDRMTVRSNEQMADYIERLKEIINYKEHEISQLQEQLTDCKSKLVDQSSSA